MDAIIDFDEVTDFLKNPPSLEPRPDFTKIRALRKHIVMALAQLQCPQEAIHGWSGLAVDYHPAQPRPHGRLPGVGRPK